MHPVLFRIGTWPLSSYVVLLGIAALVSLWYFKSLEPRMEFGGRGDFWLLTNLIVFMGMVGGWLLAVGLRLPGAGRWDFSAEGLPTFGVLPGVVAGVWLFTKLRPGHFLHLLDFVFVVVPVCHGIARLGCFLAGCCYGRPVASPLPWSVVFHDPQSEIPARLLGFPLHPTQLYEATGDFVLAAFLGLVLLPRVRAKTVPPGSVCLAYFAGYGLVRLVVDFYRGDTPAAGLSSAQILALVALGLAIFVWAVRLAVENNSGSPPHSHVGD